MLDPAIEDFLVKRKEKWLKKELKSSDNEEQINKNGKNVKENTV